MTIDIHNHIWTREYPFRPLVGYLRQLLLPPTSPTPRSPAPPRRSTATSLPSASTHDGSDCIAEMDEAGIDLTINTAIDGSCALGVAPKSVEDQNRELAEICAAHPDRYIFFSCIDPRADGALQFVERSVEEWKAKGFKFHPNMSGLFPWHEASYPHLRTTPGSRTPRPLPHRARCSSPWTPSSASPKSWSRSSPTSQT